MRTPRRLFLLGAVLLALTLGVAVVLTATQNALPKYNASGSLVDSAVSEVNGNVGIGTTSPNTLLEVRRDQAFSGAVGDPAAGETISRITNYSSTGVASVELVTGAGADVGGMMRLVHDSATSGDAHLEFRLGGSVQERMRIDKNGNVGIGTTSPQAALDVNGPTRHRNRLDLYDGTAGTLSNQIGAGRDIGIMGAGAASDMDLKAQGNFAVATNNTSTASLFANTSGNVGIGTTSPTAKLHVAGNVNVDGNIAAKYQDVAEWVPSHGRVAPGTVVVIGRGETNIVQASERSYDTAVAGVVSPQPGIVLGEKGAGKLLVAHTGRVRVRVDASYGAVEAGDVLVTSPTRGYAMRSEPVDIGGTKFHRPGTLLGKALEALQRNSRAADAAIDPGVCSTCIHAWSKKEQRVWGL